MRKLVIGILAAAVMCLLSVESATARACSDELQACKARCSGEYRFTGERLARCLKTDCQGEFYVCKDTGRWKTRNRTITGLEKR